MLQNKYDGKNIPLKEINKRPFVKKKALNDIYLLSAENYFSKTLIVQSEIILLLLWIIILLPDKDAAHILTVARGAQCLQEKV